MLILELLVHSSYGDLNNRSLLLVLVAKGRLGDTFPSTFHCLDMRARNRSEVPSVMMSTLIQELGRLCRYCKDSDTRPYALVSKQLEEDIREARALAEANQEDRLVSLLRSHGKRLDSHMMLMEGTRWEAKEAECTTMRELVTLMRSCCKAREKGDVAVLDEDNASGRSKKIAAYDAGRRGMDLSREERYHERRLLLLAEPQLGKTGAALGLIEVRAASHHPTVVVTRERMQRCLSYPCSPHLSNALSHLPAQPRARCFAGSWPPPPSLSTTRVTPRRMTAATRNAATLPPTTQSMPPCRRRCSSIHAARLRTASTAILRSMTCGGPTSKTASAAGRWTPSSS